MSLCHGTYAPHVKMSLVVALLTGGVYFGAL